MGIKIDIIIIPPKIWHGTQNISDQQSSIINIVDKAYEYESPDHWRVAKDCEDIPYRF